MSVTNRSLARGTLAVCCAAVLAGCATTTVNVTSAAPAASLCQSGGEHISALVLWGPRWRPDQKEPERREAAAEQGIKAFFADGACYSNIVVRRVALDQPPSPAQIAALAGATEPKPDQVLVLTVRELGPVIKLLASPALVDGGTDVVLDVGVYDTGDGAPEREFTIHWQNGGPGVIKGVGTLADDMRSALAAGLKPVAGNR